METRGRGTNNRGKQPQNEVNEPNNVNNQFMQFLDAIRNIVPLAPPLIASPQPNSGNNGTLVEQFRKLQPPTFEGGLNPLMAEDWIAVIERIFDLIDCPDIRKVTCATFMLSQGARHWWDSTARSRPQGHVWSWDQFKELFLKKYYPTNIRTQKEAEFLILRQGNSTLTEYERKFDELSRFAPLLVDTEPKRARRFEQGLKDDLRQAVVTFELGTYHEVLAKAQLANFREISNNYNEPPQSGPLEKRKWEDKGNGKQDYVKKSKEGPTSGNYKQNPVCEKCQKRHAGQCLMGTGACYNCGEIGHVVKFCPKYPQLSDDEN